MSVAKTPTRRSTRPAKAIAPEGPYETDQASTATRASKLEGMRFVDFAERLEDAGDASLMLHSQGREMRMIIHLIRNHLQGLLTTSSALAAASGQSYGTALRSIAGMTRRGLIVKRRRTATGRTYSLHPTALLLGQWEIFARRTRILVGSVFRLHLEDVESPDARRTGAKAESEIVPPPPILDFKLTLGRALRMLVHADPTFIAMTSLKRHFEMILGVAIGSRALSIDKLREEVIRNSALPRSKYDIVACDLPWFGEMAAEGRLLPLDRFMAETGFDVSDFQPDALASVRFEGRHYGLPILVTAETLVYRTDLLAEAGLPPPSTVDATVETARRLHDPARGLAGISWNGERGTPVGHTFIMIMGASFGQPVINLRPTPDGFDAEHASGENFRPMFLSEAAGGTADYLKRLVHRFLESAHIGGIPSKRDDDYTAFR
jgi:multiple sugar transport system substrate-binding protein